MTNREEDYIQKMIEDANLDEAEMKRGIERGQELMSVLDSYKPKKRRWKGWGNLNGETTAGISVLVILGLVGTFVGLVDGYEMIGAGVSTLGVLFGLILIHRGNANAAITRTERKEFERFMEEVLFVELGKNALCCNSSEGALEGGAPIEFLASSLWNVREYDICYLPMRALKILPIQDAGAPEMSAALNRYMNTYKSMCDTRRKLFEVVGTEAEIDARKALFVTLRKVQDCRAAISKCYAVMISLGSEKFRERPAQSKSEVDHTEEAGNQE